MSSHKNIEGNWKDKISSNYAKEIPIFIYYYNACNNGPSLSRRKNHETNYTGNFLMHGLY
jgi:hypothetical protein